MMNELKRRFFVRGREGSSVLDLRRYILLLLSCSSYKSMMAGILAQIETQ